MFDLRAAATTLIENPLVPVPPVEGVVARARRYRAVRLRRQAGASVLLAALFVTAVFRVGLIGDTGPDSLRTVDEPGLEEAPAGVRLDATTMFPGLPGGSLGPSSPLDYGDSGWGHLRSGRSCPTRVDAGLKPVKILAGTGSPQLPDAPHPLEVVQALVDYHNFVGGICGRALELVKRSLDDPVPEDVVGIVGTPLDPHLDAAIAGGRLERLGVPVVADGLTNVQHHSRIAYPVGTSADALVRIALDRAVSRGARTFAIVYEGDQGFARDALDAFSRYTSRTGGAIREVIDVSGSEASIAAAADRFRQACDNKRCDSVVLALLPGTGDHWLQTRPPVANVETTALPTLLTGGIPESCFRTRNERCDGLTAWTGFTPWFAQFRYLHDYQRHSLQLSAMKGGAMTEGVGLSARVLVKALQQAGPTVTRTTLRAVLETTTFVADPNVVLHWGSSLPRAGNPKAQRWRMDVETTEEWARDAGETSASYAGGTADVHRAWAERMAEWAGTQPAWADSLAAYTADDLRRWLEATGKAADEDTAAWMKDVQSQPGRALPPSPPPPTYAPLAPPELSVPVTPMPDKWWTPEGDWRYDPG